jgi:hypothetical protein
MASARDGWWRVPPKVSTLIQAAIVASLFVSALAALSPVTTPVVQAEQEWCDGC